MDFLLNHFLPMWKAGGALMWALLALAGLIYYTALELLFYVSRRPAARASRDEIAAAVDDPWETSGELGDIAQFTQEEMCSIHGIATRFADVRTAYIQPIERRLTYLVVLVSAAPLTGLLGTVAGMLDTFRGLSVSVGGQTVDLVADGISQALITTQAGLIIAIPGYVIAGMITRRKMLLDAGLGLLESSTMQKLHRSLLATG